MPCILVDFILFYFFSSVLLSMLIRSNTQHLSLSSRQLTDESIFCRPNILSFTPWLRYTRRCISSIHPFGVLTAFWSAGDSHCMVDQLYLCLISPWMESSGFLDSPILPSISAEFRSARPSRLGSLFRYQRSDRDYLPRHQHCGWSSEPEQDRRRPFLSTCRCPVGFCSHRNGYRLLSLPCLIYSST
jgi:hypothetical protein